MERPTTLVLLLNDKDQFLKAKDTLTQEGLSVVAYNNPDDAQNCKTFFENQIGALITTPDLFSGMEAANVIWVTSGKASQLTRSNNLRAIEKLCVIDSSAIGSILDPTIENGFKVDGKFARCHWSFEERLFKSSSHQPIVLCHTCAADCHQSSQIESLTPFRNLLY